MQWISIKCPSKPTPSLIIKNIKQPNPANPYCRGSVDKNKIQLPRITVPTTVNTTWVFHPLCTSAAFRAYFMTVLE
jgi:hypothetical protein